MSYNIPENLWFFAYQQIHYRENKTDLKPSKLYMANTLWAWKWETFDGV